MIVVVVNWFFKLINSLLLSHDFLQYLQAMHSAPMYIAETAPSQIRGQLISLKEFFIVLGMLVSIKFLERDSILTFEVSISLNIFLNYE